MTSLDPSAASGRPERIAVVGAGVSGLTAAYLLSRQHEVVLYEKNTWLGGHANTVDVECPEGKVPVDTGFIVFNPGNYPNFSALIEHLEVGTVNTDMSLGVSVDDGRLEYSSLLQGLFGFLKFRLRESLGLSCSLGGGTEFKCGPRLAGRLFEEPNFIERFGEEFV